MFRRQTVPVATLMVLLAISTGHAQERPSTTIESFRGLDWGSNAATVLAAFGEPEEDTMLDGGLRMLAFRDALVDRPSVLLFGILPDAGLVKGQEIITMLEGQECIDQMRRIHNLVDMRYPLIRPTEEARNSTSLTICEAVIQGSGYWHRQWIDEISGSVVSVRLDSGSTQVNLIYESLQFREWVGAPLEVVPDAAAAIDDVIDQTP